MKQLQDYLVKLQVSKDETITDFLFTEMVNLAEPLLGLSDQKLASLLLVPVPSIKRWKSGENLPAGAWRAVVFSCLRKQIKDLLVN